MKEVGGGALPNVCHRHVPMRGEERHPENMVLCCHICKHYNLGKGLEFLNAFPREGYICKASQWLRNRETSLKQTS